jgi:protein SCO1/2
MNLAPLARSLTSVPGGMTALLAALLLAGPVQAEPAPAPELKAGVFSPPRAAPDFSLRGSDGRELNLGHYRGKIVLLGFGFTSCPDVCPTTLATLAQARRHLGPAAADVQVVYITVDPERDGIERLKKYLGTFDPGFVGGTGTPEQISAVRKAYGILAQKKSYGSAYTIAHSSYILLIDRNGKLRALMPYGRGPDDYVHDLKILLQQ